MEGLIRCPRCLGRKNVYKIGSGYSHVDTGGILIDCPMCLGKGKVKNLETILTEVSHAKEERKKRRDTINRKKEDGKAD